MSKEFVSEAGYYFTNMIWKRNISQTAPHMKQNDVCSAVLNRVGLAGLQYQVPGFFVKSKHVEIILEPQSFYQKIMEKCLSANKRIIFASLYVGTNIMSENLVSVIQQRMKEKPDIQVKILIDCTRGSRGEVNSRTLLLPLLQKHEKSCKVSLFHTPSLHGPLHKFLPDRYREILGVQHIKAYIFDDDLLISGANLSYSYFTKRQDRYMMISECKDLSDFMAGLVDKISECSLQLNKYDDTSLHEKWKHHPIEADSKVYTAAARDHILNFYYDHVGAPHGEVEDTIVFPLLEMGPFNIHVDSKVTTNLLQGCGGCKVHLATAYFNLTQSYTETIINRSKAVFRILMSHPTNNSFFNAKGPAGGIPNAYTILAAQFFNKVQEAKQYPRIKMFEFLRSEWTFHSKGLWLTFPGEQTPCLTLIGSPNFGERSVTHDLECQFLVVTAGKQLQEDLLNERKYLYKTSVEFNDKVIRDPQRQSPFWVRVIVWLFRSYL